MRHLLAAARLLAGDALLLEEASNAVAESVAGRQEFQPAGS